MRGASLSLVGMYNWNNTLFDGMAFPSGFDSSDKQLFVNNLVMECAELEVLYSDWDFLKAAIDLWSQKELITWERIYQLSIMQYNPIENYNRTENTNIQNRGAMTHSGTDSVAGSGNDSDVATGYDSVVGSGNTSDVASGNTSDVATGYTSDVGTGNTSDVATGNTSDVSTGTDTVTRSVTSFDSNTYQPAEKTEDGKGTTITHNRADTITHNRNDTITHNRNDTITHNRNDTITHNRADTETYNRNSTITHNHGTTDTTTYGHVITDTTGTLTQSTISGNIGVTTSQQMATQELELAPKLNIINIMIESFQNRFCLLVY